MHTYSVHVCTGLYVHVHTYDWIIHIYTLPNEGNSGNKIWQAAEPYPYMYIHVCKLTLQILQDFFTIPYWDIQGLKKT